MCPLFGGFTVYSLALLHSPMTSLTVPILSLTAVRPLSCAHNREQRSQPCGCKTYMQLCNLRHIWAVHDDEFVNETGVCFSNMPSEGSEGVERESSEKVDRRRKEGSQKTLKCSTSGWINKLHF